MRESQRLNKHCLQFRFASPSSLLAFTPSTVKVATALKYRVVTHCMAQNGFEASCTGAGHQDLVMERMLLTLPDKQSLICLKFLVSKLSFK